MSNFSNTYDMVKFSIFPSLMFWIFLFTLTWRVPSLGTQWESSVQTPSPYWHGRSAVQFLMSPSDGGCWLPSRKGTRTGCRGVSPITKFPVTLVLSALLSCTVLYYNVWHCTVLYCTVLYRTVMCCHFPSLKRNFFSLDIEILPTFLALVASLLCHKYTAQGMKGKNL